MRGNKSIFIGDTVFDLGFNANVISKEFLSEVLNKKVSAVLGKELSDGRNFYYVEASTNNKRHINIYELATVVKKHILLKYKTSMVITSTIVEPDDVSAVYIDFITHNGQTRLLANNEPFGVLKVANEIVKHHTSVLVTVNKYISGYKLDMFDTFCKDNHHDKYLGYEIDEGRIVYKFTKNFTGMGEIASAFRNDMEVPIDNPFLDKIIEKKFLTKEGLEAFVIINNDGRRDCYIEKMEYINIEPLKDMFGVNYDDIGFGYPGIEKANKEYIGFTTEGHYFKPDFPSAVRYFGPNDVKETSYANFAPMLSLDDLVLKLKGISMAMTQQANRLDAIDIEKYNQYFNSLEFCVISEETINEPISIKYGDGYIIEEMFPVIDKVICNTRGLSFKNIISVRLARESILTISDISKEEVKSLINTFSTPFLFLSPDVEIDGMTFIVNFKNKKSLYFKVNN